MAQTVIPTDLNVQGALTAKSFIPPTGSIAPAGTQGTGAPGAYHQRQNFEASQQKEYAQPSAQTAAVEAKVVHVVRGATATILDVAFGAVVAAIGAATVVFDVLKNGVSVLTGTLTLDSTTAAYALKSGTLSVTSCVAGDVIEVKVVSATAGGGTLAKGLFARVALREDPV